MPPKALSANAPSPDESEASAQCSDASASETPAGVSGDAVSNQPQQLHQALGDAVVSLLGLPLDKLEEQLQGLK